MPTGDLLDELKAARALAHAGRDAEGLAALQALVERLEAADPPTAVHRRVIGQALATRGEVQLRQGRFGAALAALTRAAWLLDLPGGERDRLYAFAAIAYCQITLGYPEHGLRAASAAAKLSLTQERKAANAQALLTVGLCSGLLGDPMLAERYTLEALGTALADSDPAALRTCLINIVHYACDEADALRAAGRDDLAAAALQRATRHVRHGEQVLAGGGQHERTIWRGNRAEWLRRRGQIDEAAPELEAVYEEALASGWVTAARQAARGRAEIARVRGAIAEAQTWFQRCVLVSPAADPHEIVAGAHRGLADLAERAGEPVRAAEHRALLVQLAQQRASERDAARSAMAELDQAVSNALGEADRRRLEEELVRLRTLRGETLASPS